MSTGCNQHAHRCEGAHAPEAVKIIITKHVALADNDDLVTARDALAKKRGLTAEEAFTQKAVSDEIADRAMTARIALNAHLGGQTDEMLLGAIARLESRRTGMTEEEMVVFETMVVELERRHGIDTEEAFATGARDYREALVQAIASTRRTALDDAS